MFRYYYVCRISVYCVRMNMILTVWCTVSDIASANKFHVKKVSDCGREVALNVE